MSPPRRKGSLPGGRRGSAASRALLVLLALLPQVHPHRASGPRFLISDRDRDPQCNLHCSRSPTKPLCASDGRTYESMCDYQRAKCRDASLSVAHRGRCKDAGQSKCRLERAQALDQAKKPQEAVFIPECSEDGSFTQVQCHTYTGYCWCVTLDGKPISGSSVQNKTPVCSGTEGGEKFIACLNADISGNKVLIPKPGVHSYIQLKHFSVVRDFELCLNLAMFAPSHSQINFHCCLSAALHLLLNFIICCG